MKKVLKNIIKFSFLVTFIIFSLQSIMSYLKGDVIFEHINEYNEHLVFPSLTICPKLTEAIVNLKIDKLATDLNISIDDTTIIPQLIQKQRDPLSFVKKYIFSQEDIFPESSVSKSAFMWVMSFRWRKYMNIFCLDCQIMEPLLTLYPCKSCTMPQKSFTKSLTPKDFLFLHKSNYQLESKRSMIILAPVLTW